VLKSDFVTSCSNFVARITPALTTMQATHMYAAARTYFCMLLSRTKIEMSDQEVNA
jgi:hypothetical protein